ncbi:hypothetical protein AVEN_247338-2 [Araneus ventricosus]|uniref:Uncharacterized protein n=1 Tax=Araneus ventricosus TaxID=182803 RepID=A0A4Y2P2H2_ARAVE|nr:hypothetical protein AVEN_247338-2 [Araneus ventricosus]
MIYDRFSENQFVFFRKARLYSEKYFPRSTTVLLKTLRDFAITTSQNRTNALKGGQYIVRKKLVAYPVMIGPNGEKIPMRGGSGGGGASSAVSSGGGLGGGGAASAAASAGGGSAFSSSSGGGFSSGGSSSTTIIRSGGGYSGGSSGFSSGGSSGFSSGGGYSSSGGSSGFSSGGGYSRSGFRDGSSSGGMYGLGLRARNPDESDDADNQDNSSPDEEVLYIPLEQYGKFRKSGRYERSLPDITNMQMIYKFPPKDVPWIQRVLQHEESSHRDTINHDNHTGRTDSSSKHRNRNYVLPSLMEKYYEGRDQNHNLIQRQDMNLQF